MREELGDLSELKESLRHSGLIEPIMVTNEMVLVVGRRRLESAKEMGWKEIDAGVISCDDMDRKLLEIDENLQRKSFSWQEEDLAVKMRLELLSAKLGTFSVADQPRTQKGTFAQSKQPLAQFVPTDENSSDLRKEFKLNHSDRPAYPAVDCENRHASRRDIANALNVSHTTIDRQIKRAEYLERYPILKTFQEKSVVEELGRLRECGMLNEVELMNIEQLVREEHFPVQIAQSLIRLEEEKKKEITGLWRAKEINVSTAAKAIEDALEAKAKELHDSGKPQLEIGLQLGKSQPTVSRILNEKTWLLNAAGAVLALIGSGGSIDGGRIAPYALQSLLRDGIVKDGPVHGRYVFTDEALEVVSRSSGIEGSAGWYAFIHFLIFKLARFDRIKDDDKFQQYLAHIDEARRSRETLALDYSELK